MKFNISCPETGKNKVVELQNEEKMSHIIDKKIGNWLKEAGIAKINRIRIAFTAFRSLT